MAYRWQHTSPRSRNCPACPHLLPSSSLLFSSLALSDTEVYEPQIRARLGTASIICTSLSCLYRLVSTQSTLCWTDTPTFTTNNPHGWTNSMVFRLRIHLLAPLDSEGLSIHSTDLYQGVNIPIFDAWFPEGPGVDCSKGLVWLLAPGRIALLSCSIYI